MSTNILFTSSGGMHAQRLFFLIKKKSFYKDIKIHAANSSLIPKNKKVFHDSFTKISKPKNKNFLNDIKKVIKKKNIFILVPGSDEEAIKLSRHKNELNTFVSCPDKKKIKYMNNKFSIMSKMKNENLLDTNFEKVNSIKILKKKINFYKKNNNDFVIKPIFSRGGRDVITIKRLQKKNLFFFNNKREIHIKKNFFYKNQNKYLSKFKKKMPVILMDRLFEPNLDIDILSWKGKLIKYVVRQRIGFQAEKGSIILKNNLYIEKQLKRISKLFNLTGIYDCDFMFNKKKIPTLIELNPRISGSLYASIYAGINLIDDLISLKKNKISKVLKIKIRNKKRINSSEIFN